MGRIRKKILILNGTISEIPIIEKAAEMGFYVVTTGNMPGLPGHRHADEYIPEDYSDKEAVLRLVKDSGIEGIVSCANDFGVLTSSYVAERMGWAGHDTYEHAVLMHHKDRFRQYCREKGIPCPQSRCFTGREHALEYCRRAGYPVIVKANDLTGGKGIMKAENIRQAEEAVGRAFEMSRDKHVLVESFLTGVQQSIVVFLVNRKIVMTSSSNIYCMRNPYLVQAETYPAENFGDVRDELCGIITRMAQDLQLADGIFSFQYMVCGGRPYIIEMMRRCFGNETLLLADVMTGFPWEEAYIRASLGMDCSRLAVSEPEAEYCGHFGIMAERNGILKSVSIDPSIEHRLFKKTVNIVPGERIENYMNEKISHIYFTYDNLDEMNEEIIHYNEMIKVEMY